MSIIDKIFWAVGLLLLISAVGGGGGDLEDHDVWSFFDSPNEVGRWVFALIGVSLMDSASANAKAAKIEHLEGELADLEGELADLEGQLADLEHLQHRTWVLERQAVEVAQWTHWLREQQESQAKPPSEPEV